MITFATKRGIISSHSCLVIAGTSQLTFEPCLIFNFLDKIPKPLINGYGALFLKLIIPQKLLLFRNHHEGSFSLFRSSD
jgi:hypothetical protein